VPVVFIFIVTTDVLAFISYKNFIKRKEVLNKINYTVTLTKLELKRKGEMEKNGKNYVNNDTLFKHFLSFVNCSSIYSCISMVTS
jgi:hypothetical protein